ncbi:MAG: DUF1109 domain-containing protein [Amaricoccus sp.]
MRTDALIRAMAADTTRARPPGPTLAVVVLGLAALAAAVFLPELGMRPDLGPALMRAAVMVKQVAPLLVAVGGFGAALRLARPGEGVGGWALALLAVPLMLAVAVGATMAALPRAGWHAAMMGSSNGQCLLWIVIMGLPLLAGTLWVLRAGASTRPALTGAMGGLLAGGTAAVVYSLHCTEDSPMFYAVWYVLAILCVALLGAVAGARVLRW